MVWLSKIGRLELQARGKIAGMVLYPTPVLIAVPLHTWSISFSTYRNPNCSPQDPRSWSIGGGGLCPARVRRPKCAQDDAPGDG